MPQQALPTAIPADLTPATFSGTLMTAFLLDRAATSIASSAVTTTANAIVGATTIAATLTGAVPSGTVLNFGGLLATLTAPAAATDTALTVAALTAAIPSGSNATYTPLMEFPLAEDFSAMLASTEEVVKIHGRFTPKRTITEYDFTSTIKVIAPITDPVIRKLVVLGASGGEARMIFQYADGFFILATVVIGAPKRTAAVGATERYEFTANLSGDLYWGDRNEATPAFHKFGVKLAS